MVKRLDDLNHFTSDLDVESDCEVNFPGGENPLQSVGAKEQTRAVLMKGSFSACVHVRYVLSLPRPK